MRNGRKIKYDAMEEVKTVKMEELYITPFTARREYDKEGLIQGFPLSALAPPLIGAGNAGREKKKICPDFLLNSLAKSRL